MRDHPAMRGLALALCAGLFACARAQEVAQPARDPAPRAPVPLAYSGCLRMETGATSRCELTPERRMVFWLPSTSSELRVSGETTQHVIAPTHSERLGDGTRYEFVIPAGVGQLSLSAADAGRWQLQLEDAQDAAVLVEARALRQRGQLQEARRSLELAHPQLPAALQRRARAELARIALQEGDYAAAASGLTQTFDAALEQGSISEAFNDGTALAFVLSSNLRRFEQARAVLARLEPLGARDDVGRALLPHYRGVLALETGDLRLALREFREAAQRTSRLGLRDHELLAREQEAWSLSLLGQHTAAIAAQKAIANDFNSGDPCQRADRHESVIWYSILAQLDAAQQVPRGAAQQVPRGAAQQVLHAAAQQVQVEAAQPVPLEATRRTQPAAAPQQVSTGTDPRAVGADEREYSERAARELRACTSPWRSRNHVINAGLLALAHGELSHVAEQLHALDQMESVQDPLLEAWELLLRGRHALQGAVASVVKDAGRNVAVRDRGLALFRRALVQSQRHELWETEHLAQLGIARSLRAAGKVAQALAAYRAAEAALDRSLFRVPLAEGLGGARHAREAGTYELVELLLAERDAAGALAVARRARARGLALLAAQERVPSLSTEARSRWEHLLERYHQSRVQAATLRESAWQLPREREAERRAQIADEEQSARDALDEAYAVLLATPWNEPQAAALAPEAEGRATLALFAVRDGVQGFAFGCGKLSSVKLPPLTAAADAATLGEAWLAPFASELSCASELRVITPAALSTLDVAAWQLDGQLVLTRWAVSYALDSSETPQPSAADARGSALRVVDPRADLPQAAREAEIALPTMFTPARTLARASATRGEILHALPDLALFHYAGHHRFAGAEGSESELLLSDGTLSVADVLTLSAAPRFTVLSACDSAKLEAPGFAGGLDLAYAFILKGSEAVVAATRPVHDEQGHAMMTALYAELAHGAGDARDWARALQAAQRRVHADHPNADWSAFRVITR